MSNNTSPSEKIRKKSLLIAPIVMRCSPDPDHNLKEMLTIIDVITHKNPYVDLIFFGETILGWYDKGDETAAYHQKVALSTSDRIIEALIAAAKNKQIYLCFGFTERFNGKIYNSQILVNPKGEIQAHHRKFHLKGNTFSPGSQPVTFTDINGVKTAMIICYDAQSKQVISALLNSEIDLLLFSLADDEDKRSFAARLSANLYDFWIVTANRIGNEGGHYWNGHQVISDPWGRLRIKNMEKELSDIYQITFKSPPNRITAVFRKLIKRFLLFSHLIFNIRIIAGFLKAR
jgi:predicted amidohydrolase